MIPARRHWVQSAAALLAAQPLLGITRNETPPRRLKSPAVPLDPQQRWPTGNRRLAPLTCIDECLLYVGERTQGLIDPARPAPLWQLTHTLSGGLFRPRCDAAAGLALFASAGGLLIRRIEDGTLLWQCRPQRQFGVPVLAGGAVLLGDGHELVAFNAATGKERWRFAAIADTQISYATVVSGDSVFVGPGDGRLYALALADGRQRWQLDRMAAWQYLRQLQVSGDVLVAGSYKEKLYGIALADGAVRWEFAAGNFINSQHVADGSAYLWSPTGWLYAIDTADGNVRWRQRTTDYRNSADNWASLLAELASVDGRLFALDLAHTLHVLDCASGAELECWRSREALHAFVTPRNAQGWYAANTRSEILLFTA